MASSVADGVAAISVVIVVVGFAVVLDDSSSSGRGLGVPVGAAMVEPSEAVTTIMSGVAVAVVEILDANVVAAEVVMLA